MMATNENKIDFARFDRFAICMPAYAHAEATRVNHDYAGAEHLLLGAAKLNDIHKETPLIPLLVERGIGLREVRLAFYDIFPSGPEFTALGRLPKRPGYIEAVRGALEFTDRLSLLKVEPNAFFYGIINVKSSPEFSQLLEKLKINPEEMSAEIESTLAAI